MKLTLKSNGKITGTLTKLFEGEEVTIKKVDTKGDIYAVEIDFEPCALYSDIEIWLDDENGNLCDHIALNVSKRNKLQAHK